MNVLLPNTMIAGCVRCGTTWLSSNLRMHPDVFIHKKKEAHFFSRDVNYQQGIPFYESQFADWSGQKRVVDVTPTCFSNAYVSFDIAARIHQHLPEIKLIVSLRNPMERIVSQYWHLRSKFPKNQKYTFEEVVHRRPEFIQEGNYIDHFQHYLKYFSREQIHVVIFDDIEEQPEEVLESVYSYLDLESIACSPLVYTRINSAYSKKHEGKSFLFWYLHRAFFKMKFFKAAEVFEQFNYDEKQEISAEVKEHLCQNYYAERINQLEEFLQRDLTSWRI